MTTLISSAAAIERAVERAERASDALDAADELLGTDPQEEGALESAAIAQAHALASIAGYLGALTDLAHTALREEVAKP